MLNVNDYDGIYIHLLGVTPWLLKELLFCIYVYVYVCLWSNKMNLSKILGLNSPPLKNNLSHHVHSLCETCKLMKTMWLDEGSQASVMATRSIQHDAGGSTYHVRECRDDLAERGEWLVDVSPLFEACTRGACGVGSLAARQIYQADLAHLQTLAIYAWIPDFSSQSMTRGPWALTLSWDGHPFMCCSLYLWYFTFGWNLTPLCIRVLRRHNLPR